MRGLNRVSRLFAGGMLAASALCLAGCGEYALFRIHATTSSSSTVPVPNNQPPSERADIINCVLTISDEGGHIMLSYSLPGSRAALDSNGNIIKDASGSPQPQGCQGQSASPTSADLGKYSYSTTHMTGNLTFQIDGWDANNTVVLQTGRSAPIAPTPYPPEVSPIVEITMK